jgi:hypothetical protein
MFPQIENFLEPREVPTIAQIARRTKFIAGKLANPHNILGDNSDPMARQTSPFDSADMKALASSLRCNGASVPMWSR